MRLCLTRWKVWPRVIDFSYRCIECGREYEIEPDRMLCEACSKQRVATEPLRGIFEVQLSGNLDDDWDVHDLLPVERKWFPSVPVGNTPLWSPERMRDDCGFGRLYLKDDTANPTGSLKDRASYLVAAFARQHGVLKIVLASTGNAGSSMAGIGAAAGIDVKLYLPKTAPKAKLTQAAQYGAEIIRVDGTYDLAFDLATAAAENGEGMSRNTAYNPLTIEGKKTAAIEIVRQLAALEGRTHPNDRANSRTEGISANSALRTAILQRGVPDYVFVPAGDGVILSGVYKGFEDLVLLKVIDRMPKIIAVQAEGSSAIARALDHGEFDTPVAATTIADSISVDVPRGGYFALQRLRRHDGETVIVTDEQILEAQHYLAAQTGLFAEPAATATVAGFLKRAGNIPSESIVVLLITGSGLKDIDGAMKGIGLDD
jgi:threonine synthase